MAARKVFPLENENKHPYTSKKKYEDADGVCAGASLTWLARAMKGNVLYNPHTPGKNLELSKQVMGAVLDTDGELVQKINAGAKIAGFPKSVKFTQRPFMLNNKRALEYIENWILNHKYHIIFAATHVMAAAKFSFTWYLLDNMNGLYNADTLKECLYVGEGGKTLKSGYGKWVFMHI